jgi:glycosyltransferase involved in cell wall biosynthesis
MKIYFDSVNWNSTSGPNSAVKRIAIQLARMGHTIADVDDYDISLVTIEPTQKLNLDKPFVHRLDGIWSKPQEFATRNVNIRACYNNADGVVFQSQFDKKMITKWFGEPRHNNAEVILNGIELKHVDVNIPTLFEMREKYDKIFVSSANWHPQKRLKDNTRLFKHLQKTQFPNSCFIVMGANPDHVIADNSVFYTGSQDENTCLQVFAAADWMIHLARTDHCPNVCVQSLSQETPVVCVSSGGTREIVRQNGVIIEDAKFDYELEDYDAPPQVPDIESVQLPDNKSIKIDSSYLNIEECAASYVRLFEIVLDTWSNNRKQLR